MKSHAGETDARRSLTAPRPHEVTAGVPGSASTRFRVWESAPALIIFAVQSAGFWPSFIDDSYIYYRYAVNWTSGRGPVFNYGEYVEGYSSSLWLVILAILAELGTDLEWSAPLAGVVIGAFTLILFAIGVHSVLRSDRHVTATAALALALPTGYACYSVSGMETPLMAATLLAAVLTLAASEKLQRPAPLAALCLSLLVFARAEGPVYALFLAVVAIGWSYLNRGTVSRSLMLVFFAVITAVLASFLIRMHLYGQLMPTTVLAKRFVIHFLTEAISGRGTFEPVVGGVVAALGNTGWRLLLVFMCVAMLGALALRRGVRIPLEVVLAMTATSIGLGVTVAAGGDWMPFRRHLIPIAPLLLLAAAWCVSIWTAESRRWPLDRVAVAGALLWTGLAFGGPPPNPGGSWPPFRWLSPTYEGIDMALLGRVIADLPGAPRVLTNVAGRLPYHAGSRIYVWDMLGLTDLHNGTRGDEWRGVVGRTDYEYSYSRPFDILVTIDHYDIEKLFDFWSRRPESQGAYVYYPTSKWGSGTVVISRRDQALVTGLERACTCVGVVVEPSTERVILANTRGTRFPVYRDAPTQGGSS